MCIRDSFNRERNKEMFGVKFLAKENIPRKISGRLGFEPGPMQTLVKFDPEAASFYEHCDRVILSDGALPAKYKMMLVMCIGAVRMCSECVSQSMRAALNLGATRREILEALRVAFVSGGAQTVRAAKEALETVLAGVK